MEMRFEDRVHEAAMGYSALSAKESFQDTLEAFKAGVDWAIREYPVMKDIREQRLMAVDHDWMKKHEMDVRYSTVMEVCGWMKTNLGRIVNTYSGDISEVCLRSDMIEKMKSDLQIYGRKHDYNINQ